LSRCLPDPRLRQLFGRYATYCGSSPFSAPATLMLVAHVEQQGVWLVKGGMHRIAQSLTALACERGARVRCGNAVREILVQGGRACGVRLATGESLAADAVVYNGDAASLARGLLGPGVLHAAASVPARRRSLSAVTWNLRAPTHGFALSRHNVFFGGNSAKEFGDIFDRGGLPADPTVYVCAQDRPGGERATVDGPERLLLIVNAAARGDDRPIPAEELARCEAKTFERLRRCGLQIETTTAATRMTTPSEFEALYPGTGGALYGAASHGWLATFRRPGARSRLPGLYLTGGSVHPGPGVPMAALSGRQAAASLLADLPARVSSRASTARSRPVDTHGGTSTP
jgi:1-hydroxycarotenoid 3,4-desaturase